MNYDDLRRQMEELQKEYFQHMLELKKEMERLQEEYRLEMKKNVEYMQKLKETTQEEMKKINTELLAVMTRRKKEDAMG